MTTEVEEEFFNIVQSWKDIELDRIAILKSACQKLAKLKYEAATPHFIEMISATDDDDVFVSGVLALALTKSPAMIEPLVDNHSRLGQGNSFTVENALEDNVELLLQILKDQTEPLTPTIKAVGIIGEKGALLYLENLLQTRPELQELLAETIQKIK
jgi:HEAT repeat protein